MDTKKLNEKIDNLREAGICEKGIQAVRELVEEITGEKLQAEIKSYHRGQRLRNPDSGAEYIIASTDVTMMALISLRDGNRYRSPVSVECFEEISRGELNKMGGTGMILIPS